MVWTPTGVSLSMGNTGQFRLAGTSGGLWSNLCLKAGSDQVAQGFIQQSLENLQERLHNLSGQPVPLPGCPDGEIVSPYIQSPPYCFACACRLSTHHGPGSAVLITTPQVLLGPCEARSSPGWMRQALPVSPHRLLCNFWLTCRGMCL